MDETAAEVGVPIITGDTKTVEKTALDSIILNTAGLGITDNPVRDSGLQAWRQNPCHRHYWRSRDLSYGSQGRF